MGFGYWTYSTYSKGIKLYVLGPLDLTGWKMEKNNRFAELIPFLLNKIGSLLFWVWIYNTFIVSIYTYGTVINKENN